MTNSLMNGGPEAHSKGHVDGFVRPGRAPRRALPLPRTNTRMRDSFNNDFGIDGVELFNPNSGPFEDGKDLGAAHFHSDISDCADATCGTSARMRGFDRDLPDGSRRSK